MRLTHSYTRWFTAALLGGTLSACAYIIPPSPNEPRNNTVQGEIRKPINNPTSSGKRSALTPDELPNAAPVAPVKQAALPPVDNATQQRAEAIIQNSDRRMPVENAQFQVSSNGYPPIHSVPPMPVTTGPDSAQSQLNATKAELEADRSNAVAATETLAKDAAAEPSMLSELPKIDGVVPVNDPINVAPVTSETKQAAPAKAAPQSSISAPTAEVKPLASVATPIEAPAQTVVASSLPNIPAFAPPAPLKAAVVKPAVVTAAKPEPVGAVVKPASAPTVTASAAPNSFKVDLTPSEPATITAQPLAAPSPALAANAAVPHVRAGDFDPLAVADNAPVVTTKTSSRVILSSSYASNRYIAPSRYSSIRN